MRIRGRQMSGCTSFAWWGGGPVGIVVWALSGRGGGGAGVEACAVCRADQLLDLPGAYAGAAGGGRLDWGVAGGGSGGCGVGGVCGGELAVVRGADSAVAGWGGGGFRRVAGWDAIGGRGFRRLSTCLGEGGSQEEPRLGMVPGITFISGVASIAATSTRLTK